MDELKLSAWIDGWVDATGEYFTDMCTKVRTKKKLIDYLNCISGYPEVRKTIFDGVFKNHGYVYDIDTDTIIKA